MGNESAKYGKLPLQPQNSNGELKNESDKSRQYYPSWECKEREQKNNVDSSKTLVNNDGDYNDNEFDSKEKPKPRDNQTKTI